MSHELNTHSVDLSLIQNFVIYKFGSNCGAIVGSKAEISKLITVILNANSVLK